MDHRRRTPLSQRAETLALLAVFFWSTVATAFKWTLRYVEPVDLLAVASLTSLAIYGLTVLRQGLWKEFRSLQRSARLQLLALGVLNPLLYYLVLFTAYHRLPAQVAQPLNYTWPMVLSLLSVPILHHRVRLWDIAGLLLGFLGVWLVSSQGNPGVLRVSDPLGITLAVGSSVIWATYWLLNVRIQATEEVKLFTNFLLGTPVILSIWMVSHDPHRLPVQGIGGGIYVGFFEMGWTFLLWMKALRHTPNTARIANLVYLSPILSLFFIWAVLKEAILWTTPLGLTLILTGIGVQRRSPQMP